MVEQCGFEGDPDLYGLGIRISLYIQLVTMLAIPVLGIPQYNRFFTSTGLSLFAATWIVILKQSNEKQMKGVELYFFSWLNLSQLVAIFMVQMMSFTSFMSLRKIMNPKKITYINIAFVTIFAFLTCYFTWFFWRGLDVLPRSGCDREDYAFFFSKAPVYGWLRTLQKVIWTMMMVVAGVGVLLLPCVYLISRGTLHELEAMADFSDPEVDSILRNVANQMRFQISIPLIISSAGMVTFVALSAELPIRWNGISGVNAIKPVGQLVPLIVAIGQSFNVIYQATKRLRDQNEDDDDESEDGEVAPCSYLYGEQEGYDLGR